MAAGRYSGALLCRLITEVERLLDTLSSEFLLAGDALGVHAMEHLDAVSGPLGNLGCRDTAAQPGRHCGVP